MICCITGNRPEKFPFNYREKDSHEMILYTDALYRKAEELMRRGYTGFLTGMARGVDLDFACAVIYHKCETFWDILDITLEAAMPYPEQTRGWPRRYREEYEYVLSHCDKKTLVSSGYFTGCEQKRNRYMVERADLILCCIEREKGGAWQTVRYAMKQGKDVINLANDDEAVNLL